MKIPPEIKHRLTPCFLAVPALSEAVRREDRMRYIGPPDRLQPARHSLGAILIAAAMRLKKDFTVHRSISC